jgi:hypothetical protein
VARHEGCRFAIGERPHFFLAPLDTPGALSHTPESTHNLIAPSIDAYALIGFGGAKVACVLHKSRDRPGTTWPFQELRNTLLTSFLIPFAIAFR